MFCPEYFSLVKGMYPSRDSRLATLLAWNMRSHPQIGYAMFSQSRIDSNLIDIDIGQVTMASCRGFRRLSHFYLSSVF